MTRRELRAQGEATLKSLFGSDEQTRGLANLLTEPVYGGVWDRPGLARADRMVCTLAALATGPRLKALRRHLAAGLDLGLSTEAIREILVQAALYAGFSAAEETLALAAEVFSERGLPFPRIRPRMRRSRSWCAAAPSSWARCTATGPISATPRPTTRSPARSIRRRSSTTV